MRHKIPIRLQIFSLYYQYAFVLKVILIKVIQTTGYGPRKALLYVKSTNLHKKCRCRRIFRMC
jgi:hypothetical protein